MKTSGFMHQDTTNIQLFHWKLHSYKEWNKQISLEGRFINVNAQQANRSSNLSAQ